MNKTGLWRESGIEKSDVETGTEPERSVVLEVER